MKASSSTHTVPPFWKDKTVLITGASSGIGEALAFELARAGARMGLLARRRERLEELAGRIRSEDGWAVALPGDVRERDDVRTAADRLTQASGPVDVLVANAGRAMRGRNETNGEAVADLYATNFLGAVYAFEAVLPGMLERAPGTSPSFPAPWRFCPGSRAVIRTRPARWPWVGISRGWGENFAAKASR